MQENISPARLHTAQVAKRLGFAEHDIPLLAVRRMLKPLGKPTQSAPKYYAACEIEKLALDVSWLNKATQTVYDGWKEKNARRKQNLPESSSPPPVSAVQSQANDSVVSLAE